MNRQGPGKIDWTDWTWNPVTGCLHGCPYCYARRGYERFGRSFEPQFHPERLGEPAEYRTPSRIFVCSTGDLFGEWVPLDWQVAVGSVVDDLAPQHTYQFLTKRPAGYHGLRFGANCWCGTTVTGGNPDVDRERLLQMAWVDSAVRFACYEPLLGPPEVTALALGYIQWVIVGAQTGPGAVGPERAWIDTILEQCARHRISMFLKDNLLRQFPALPVRKEFPQP